MRRKLILLCGLAAMLAILVPHLHQRDPNALEQLLRSVKGEPETATADAAVSRPAIRQHEGHTGRTVRIAADASGHFVADFRLNGRVVPALIDTGASAVAINRSTAWRIGLALQPADFRHQVTTANGAAMATAVTIERLQIGRIYLEDVQAIVLEDGALGGALIGMSFLRRLRRFQVEGGALLLEQ